MSKLDDEHNSKNKKISQLIDDNKNMNDQLEEEKLIKRDSTENSRGTKKLKSELDRIMEESSCDDTLNDLENILEKSDTSEKRIRELENALRETIQISTERELVLQEEENKRKNIMQKVFKLEQRLLSLQNAQALKCHSCNQYVRRMADLEFRLSRIKSERKENLKELNRMKMDAIESAISEKDAHLAFLEMNGIRNAKQADEAEKLRLDKRKLMERLRRENEISMSLSQDNELEEDSNPSDYSDRD